MPSIWIDELNHYYAAQSLNANGRAVFPSGEPNERALWYSKLVSLSFRLLGEGEFSLRLPSALLGVLGIAAVFWVARRFFGGQTALLAALFTAISPFAIGWSRLSRMYTLFQLLFLLASYAFYRGFENDARGRFAAWQHKLVPAGRLQRFLDRWNLNLFWLLTAAVLLWCSFQVHDLTALFMAGVLCYTGLQSVVHWRQQGVTAMVRSKYFITFWLLVFVPLLALLALPSLRAFVDYALGFMPKWAEGTRFQRRMLLVDFLFDHYQFPLGLLFVIGAYQILGRAHRAGLYVLSLFLGTLLLFMTVFAYRHFQYLFHVYGFFIMVCAFAFANLMHQEAETIRQRWFARTRLRPGLVSAIIAGVFLAWLPLTPAVRLARAIPFSPDGSFNGAMYMEEWREACRFVREHSDSTDVIISTDALGTLHYLGRVDYDLNFADLDLALENQLRDAAGEPFDLYSGRPFIKDLAQLQQVTAQGRTVWMLGQHYKLLEAPVFVPVPLREFILSHFERTLTTANNTVLVYRYPPRPVGEAQLDRQF
ncbi:MAG: glycosyltransferase family 39 protein [candidate division KSB1 bacterium]|nr:glycosyltransferase family 39 protein [candidate division KSB1 bacterium]MDZ7285733.1 glycosyltransferase family 39 protein [candidate division KSB1 bacterium]MDZ7298765.1 glycosyltransferase family 39 protein [candidate division KSB1 bacterium]MDZ7305948.1 glycosyltransferase family 39 protein [candidate division KSB1 bacterium]MDZ7349630.1 glycosyltransferase family 39 protein [candidate division KSB1 bacterium]